jgi:hypothetical protein
MWQYCKCKSSPGDPSRNQPTNIVEKLVFQSRRSDAAVSHTALPAPHSPFMGQGASGGALPDFPYTVGREVCRLQPHGLWSLVDGEEIATKRPVSIFVLHSDGLLANNFLKRFKTLRHPNLLPFLHGAVVEDQRKVYVVTERVEPLSTKLQSSEYVNDPKYPQMIAWGMHCVAVRTLCFRTGTNET